MFQSVWLGINKSKWEKNWYISKFHITDSCYESYWVIHYANIFSLRLCINGYHVSCQNQYGPLLQIQQIITHFLYQWLEFLRLSPSTAIIYYLMMSRSTWTQVVSWYLLEVLKIYLGLLLVKTQLWGVSIWQRLKCRWMCTKSNHSVTDLTKL